MDSSTKRMYKLGQGTYKVTLSFPNVGQSGVSYETNALEYDKFSLTESLMNGDSLEFVGCISSIMQAQIHGANANLEGEKVIVTIDIDGQDDPLQIFVGYVKSSKTRSDLAYKEIVCYDSLWKKIADKDVSQWYNSAPFPMTMKDLRDSFFEYVDIEQEEVELCNDDIVLSKEYAQVQRMNALDVAKSICQFNAVCGIMGRDDKFKYVMPESINSSSDEENFFYKSMRYEEYITNKITRVEVRDSEDAESYAYGTGTNKYIIQGNMFIFGLSSGSKKEICQNIYDQIKDFQYRPVSYEAPALPFSEVGTTQTFQVLDWLDGQGAHVSRSFPMLSRTMEGIQTLTDKISIQGKRNQTEFITDIRAQLEALKRTTDELKNTSTKIVDYILPNDIEESNIASGGNSNIETFGFYNSSEGEKSSFYSEVNFTIATDSTDTSFGDCTLTVTIKLDGSTVLTEYHTYGDGRHILFLNYLLQDLIKGNHTLKVNFALSGGSMSQMDIESAYLLAASIVEDNTGSGEWDEYDIFDESGDWGADVLPEGLEPEMMDESAITGGGGSDMIKYDLGPKTSDASGTIQNLSQWFNTKYMLCVGQGYAEPFYKTNGYYRKKGDSGMGTSTTGKPCGRTSATFFIPIKRITGYHFFKFKGKTIQNNGLNAGVDFNYVAAGVAYVDSGGVMHTTAIPIERSVADWTEYSVGISTLPYVDYIILVGCDGSPAYKDMYFVR